MALIRGVVFDMDDTLYLERDYVSSGFMAVAKFVANLINQNATVIHQFLMQRFREGVRGRTFDLLIEQYPRLREKVSIMELVHIYRTHEPEIQLFPKMKELIGTLKRSGFHTALLSDGYLISQRMKVRALKLEALFDDIVLTDDWGKDYWKPHQRGFQHIEELWGLIGAQLVYIGDNPQKDFVAPNRLGWHTVRLRIPGQLHYHLEAPMTSYNAQKEVYSIDQLCEMILS